MKGRKIYLLAYVDDVAVLAKNEAGMKGMLRILEEYMDKKRLELNVMKTKVMRCKREGGKQKKVVWR